MYIARIRIQNYRCFSDATVDFRPGLNVIIGENNSGKTTLLRALALVFDRRNSGKPKVHDFHRLLSVTGIPPQITIAVTIRSSPNDTPADRALVSSWLTKLDSVWEAQLTYSFFLPEQHNLQFTSALNGATDRKRFFEVVEDFLPKFVSRVYAGNPATLVAADSDLLAKFDCQFLDALRDVESEMFSGSTPLFRTMLEEVLDIGKSEDEKRDLRDEFRTTSGIIQEKLLNRLSTGRLFELVHATGAGDGGHPLLEGGVDESDIISALKLFVEREQFSFPATHQGLGYNNLIYISLMLASLAFRASEEKRGQNAAIFPMLLIEEPEAHLHPALQYKLLSHIISRVKKEPNHNRQIFVTTHSTHITSAAGLDPIVCFSLKSDGTIGIAYPSRLFGESPEGLSSRCYVERYLDATKSTMLFAKATILVEGIAEQLLVPALAELLGRSFSEHHVAVIRVDGLTFKHFLPLFGATVSPEKKAFALEKRLACLVDADPSRKEKGVKKAGWKSCFHFQLDNNPAMYDYRTCSGVVNGLRSICNGSQNIGVFNGIKTLEFDLFFANEGNADFVTDSMQNALELRKLIADHDYKSADLENLLDDDEKKCLELIDNEGEQRQNRFAALYLRCAEDCKGEHAFALEQILRNAATNPSKIACPDYIRSAIEWVTPHCVTPKRN